MYAAQIIIMVMEGGGGGGGEEEEEEEEGGGKKMTFARDPLWLFASMLLTKRYRVRINHRITLRRKEWEESKLLFNVL